jgi:hypothetical protein
MRRYLLICSFYFDLVILTFLFLSLGYVKEADMTKDVSVETIPSADPEEAVDDAVSKIAKGKRSVSNGFNDTSGVCGITSDDGD